MGETVDIAIYIGKLSGLHPKDPKEQKINNAWIKDFNGWEPYMDYPLYHVWLK